MCWGWQWNRKQFAEVQKRKTNQYIYQHNTTIHKMKRKRSIIIIKFNSQQPESTPTTQKSRKKNISLHSENHNQTDNKSELLYVLNRFVWYFAHPTNSTPRLQTLNPTKYRRIVVVNPHPWLPIQITHSLSILILIYHPISSYLHFGTAI